MQKPGTRIGSGSISLSAGASKAHHCKVVLLDGSELLLEVANKKQSAQSTFDQVFRQLGVVEKEYFAFDYEDDQKNAIWLDLQKPLKKQVKKFPCTVQFRVKFYPLDPMMPDPSGRNHFYQQLRRDIITGSLKVPPQLTPCILAYVLQADNGDFESVQKDVDYIVDQKLLQDEDSHMMREEISRFHQLHQNMNAVDAVVGFLRKVRDLETYGTQLYAVQFEESNSNLGISPGGVAVFRRGKRIVFHDWTTVAEISFKNKKLLIVISGIGRQDIVVTVEMDSLKICKDVWKKCAEYASFYSDPARRQRETPVEALRPPDIQLSSDPAELQSPPHEQQLHPPAPPNQQRMGSPSMSRSARTNTIDSAAAVRASRSGKTDSAAVAMSALKSRSLPQGVMGMDPIAAALKLNRSGGGRSLNESANSVDVSISVTTPSDTLSPMSPLSPAHSGVNSPPVNVILPGMPNLRDEDGNPLNSQQQLQMYRQQQLEKGHQHQILYQQKLQEPKQQEQQQHQVLSDNAQPQKIEDKEVPIYAVPKKKHSNHQKEDLLPDAPIVTNGFSPELKTPVIITTNNNTTLMVSAESEAPHPPPRNYNSQYRTQFHSRQNSSEELLDRSRAPHKPQDSPGSQISPRLAHQQEVTHMSPGLAGTQGARHKGIGPELASGVVINRSDSSTTATDQSLLDWADELGAGNSAASVQSSLGRHSQEGAGRPGSGQRNRRAQNEYHHANTLPSSYRSGGSGSSTPLDHVTSDQHRSPHGSPSVTTPPRGGGSLRDHRRVEGRGSNHVTNWVHEQQMRSLQVAQIKEDPTPGQDGDFQLPHYETLKYTNPPQWPNMRTSPIFETSGHAQHHHHRHHHHQGRTREYNSASHLEDDRLQMEREREWELARKLEQERKMAKQREEEEEKRLKERERLIAMEREREEFRMKQMERQRERERMAAQQEKERMAKMEQEREQFTKAEEERERLAAEQERERARLEEMERKRLEKVEQERIRQLSEPAPTNERNLGRNGHLRGRNGSFPGQSVPRKSQHSSVSSNPPHLSAQSVDTGGNTDRAPDDYQLPTSPAPPPYKADTEHAQLFLKGENSPKPPPPAQFAFHSSVLGVMPDFGTTDFSGPKPQEQGASHLGMRMNLRLARHRSPRVRSPQPKSNSETQGDSRDSASPVAEEKPTRLHQLGNRAALDTETKSGSQLQAQEQPDGEHLIAQPDSINKQNDSEKKKTVQSPPRSLSPDMFQELDELLGGMNAMVSEVEFLGTERTEKPADDEGDMFESDDAVIQPPLAFNGTANDTHKENSAKQSQQSKDHLQENKSIGGSHPKPDVVQVLLSKGGKEDADSHSTSSNGSEDWLEGSPVVDDHRISSTEDDAKRVSQGDLVVPLPAGVGATLRNDGRDSLETKQLHGADNQGVEPRHEAVALIQPPSPYNSEESREGSGLRSGSGSLPSSVPPPIPPLPASHLLDEVDGRFQEDTDQGHILEDVMTFEDLPRPPAHLMALSQELEGMSLAPLLNHLSPAPAPGIPTTLPSIVTTSRTSSDSRLPSWTTKRGEVHHPRAHSSASTSSALADSVFERTESAQQLHQQEKYGRDYFSQRKVELPSSNQLPPEIANFMNRVRNFSADGSDSQVLNSLSQQSDSPGMKRSKDSLLDSIKVADQQNGISGRKDGQRKKHVEFSEATLMSKSMPVLDGDVEDSTGKLEDNQNSQNGQDGKHGPKESLVTESERVTITYEQHTSAELGKEERSSKTIKKPSLEGFESGSRAAHSQKVSIRVEEAQQQHTLAPTGKYSETALSSKSFNMKQDPQDIKMDLEVKRTHIFSGPGPNSGSAKPPPLSTSSAQRQPLMAREDSLPNSPTYFAEMQKLQNQERDTPSPSTKIMNLHFQEHLDQLGQKTQKPKSKVLDWMQEANSESISGRESQQGVKLGNLNNDKKITDSPDDKPSGLETDLEKEPERPKMKRDYKAELPSQSYQKQAPVYASLEETDADLFSAVATRSPDDEPDLLASIQTSVNIPVLTSAATAPIRTAPSLSRAPVTRTNSTPLAAPVVKTAPGYPQVNNGSSRPGIGGMVDNRARPRLPTDSSYVQRHSARYPNQRPASGSRVRTASENQRIRALQQTRPGSSVQMRSGSFAVQGDRMPGIGLLQVQTRPSSSHHHHTGRPPVSNQHFKPGQPRGRPLPTQTKSNSNQATPGQVTATFGKDYYILDV